MPAAIICTLRLMQLVGPKSCPTLASKACWLQQNYGKPQEGVLHAAVENAEANVASIARNAT